MRTSNFSVGILKVVHAFTIAILLLTNILGPVSAVSAAPDKPAPVKGSLLCPLQRLCRCDRDF